MKERIRVRKDNIEKHIYKKDLEFYMKAGWVIGCKKRKKYKKCKNSLCGRSTKNRIHITNGLVNKMVLEKDLEAYIKKGFRRGRIINRRK